MRLSQGGLITGLDRWKLVICPCRGKDPASGHPRAQKPPLGRGSSPPVWDDRLDAPSQWRGQLPSLCGPNTGQSNKESPGARAYGGKGSKGRAANGDRPI